ncbi:hypothetical protein N7466_009710 [Penicillium verhagenii]|uniref:uncharacterized protein n=1 Tax=Penicillium verhagenii TaxID=1562060 RepID=UPI0025452DDF|nr:uncharacterized protein N7466_009710 [Penicillium verhagenii]KAJ5921384.1 hypothetical protein N7466_009710 [Penicillium verhagenii]
MFGNNAQGANKPIFGSAAGTGNIFGTNANTSNAGSSATGGMFGNVGAAPSGTPSGTPSGGASASPFGAAQPSLFGSGTTNTTSGNASFGSNATSSSQKFSFGGAQPSFAGSSTPAKTETATPNTTAGAGLFGGAGGSSAFGSSNTPGPSTGSLFGTNSTTPAGPPPAAKAPLFGVNAGSTNAPSNTTPAAAPPQATGGLFGPAPTASATSKLSFASTPAAGGLFAPKPAESSTPATTTADSTPKPSMFGTTTPATGAAPNSQGTLFKMPSAGGDAAAKPSLFGGAPATANTGATLPSLGAPAASSAAPQKSLFPSLGGNTSSATPSSTPAAPAAAPAPATGLFAPKPATSTTQGATATTSTPAATSATPAPLGGLFSKPATSTPSTQPVATTTIGASADKTTAAAAAPSTTATAGAPAGTGAAALGQSTTGPAPPAQSRLKNKTMDEIITRWATDLTKYQKEFREQAEKVAEWDRMLVENGTKVQKLYGSTVDAERATQEVERQLASVEGQQDELSSWLDRYEREVDELVSKQGSPNENISGPDQERERTYKLAEKLSERLDEMGKDLTSMIEEVNGASASLTKTNRADEPISQIVRILNSHLSQLQVIDQGTSELQAKVSAAQKAGQSISSRLGYGYASPGMGGGSHVADDFYRSYMGRR